MFERDTLHETIYERVSKAPVIYEDNRVVPSEKHHKFLKGRVLSGSSSQSFECAWIFQRFINLTMHIVTSCARGTRPWYWTGVEGGRIEHKLHPSVVVFGFTLLSPFLFPIVYGIAVLVLVPFGFLSIPYIWKVKITDATNVVTTPRDILVTICKSMWYFAASALPLVYVNWPASTYTCAIDTMCEDVPFHIAPVLVNSLFSCSMIAGFRYACEISASACDGACDRQKMIILKHPRYGSALNSIVEKLSGMHDKLSYYPIFVKEEDDEVLMKLSWKKIAVLNLCAGVHALLPLVWMTIWFHQPLLSLNLDKLTAAMLFFGTVAPFYETRKLLKKFLMALEEFTHCIDQILIVQYIASSRGGKERTSLKRSFVEAVSRNDEYRTKHHKNEASVTYVALQPEEDRFADDDYIQTATRPDVSFGIESSRLANAYYVKGELEYLRVFQVAFNFTKLEGIFLFGLMRKYLCIDILNERLEVEQFANLSIVLVLTAMIFMLIMFLEGQGAGCVWIMIPYDVTILYFFIMWTLRLYAEANESLFAETEILLLTWQDHCMQWNFPESEFEEEGLPTIAWIWNTMERIAEPVQFEAAERLKLKDELDRSYVNDIYKALDSLLKSCQLLEARQELLGFTITQELRLRLIAPFGTFVGVYAAKVWPFLLQHWWGNEVSDKVS